MSRAATRKDDDFGLRLKAFRLAKGWSQDELSWQTRIATQQISRYERGAGLPSMRLARRLAAALELTLDELMGDAA